MKTSEPVKWGKRFGALGVLLALMASPAKAASADAQRSLEQWLGQLPGGVAAAYVDAGGVTFFDAGKFSTDDRRPITPDTEFEIGSLTKVFTALLLADSVHAGKVAFDATVGAPFAASKVTYAQLVTHTAGLPRLPPDFRPADPLNPYADQTLATLEQSFERAAAKAQPTAAMNYSNFGFAVLGQALAGAWGQPYEAVLTERILRPLGLKDTVTSWREADPQRLAPGHNEEGPAGHWDLNAYAPAGALVSTSRDLAKFVQACLGLTANPLAPLLAEATQPRAASDTATRKIGLAWLVEKQGEATIVWHNGGTGGFRSLVAFDPAKRVGVVVLTNHTRGVEPLGFALLAGRALPVAQASVTPAEELQPYLGNYPLAPGFVIAVTANGNELFLQATNQPRLKLRQIAADRYAVEGVAAEVAFERDAFTKVVALVLHQNGIEQRARHFPPGELPRRPQEVALSTGELDDYVGGYRLGAATFTVTREGMQLKVQLTGQPAAPVFASARDEFFYKIVDAQISFVRNDGRKVVALILHQNGLDQRAEKKP